MKRRPAWVLSGIAAAAIAIAVLIVGGDAGEFGFGDVSNADSPPASALQQQGPAAEDGEAVRREGEEHEDGDEDHEEGEDREHESDEHEEEDEHEDEDD
jgi:hypothetical protein